MGCVGWGMMEEGVGGNTQRKQRRGSEIKIIIIK